MGKIKTLDLSSESDSDSSSDEGFSKFSINKKFASDYEKRKRQQELINAAKDGEGTDDSDYSSSDESEDEDAELLTDKVDLQILKTIHKLRTKDESIYKKDQKFFSEEGMDSSSRSDISAKKSKKKKVYKDVVREQILEKMNKEEYSSNEENSDDDVAKRRNIEKLSMLEYDEEQKKIRAEFLDDNEMSDDDDQWLRKKTKSDSAVKVAHIAKEREDTLAALRATASAKLVDPKGEVEDGEKFLLDFITNKRWVDPNDGDSDEDDDVDNQGNNNKGTSDGHDSDASLEDLERTDEFESRYNFRFEEANENSGAGLSVVGYSRTALSDNIRRKDDSRKKKREERKERKAAERRAKEERLKRLKNAKKEQLEERIHQIKKVLGESLGEESETMTNKDVDEELVAKLMEGDFDEEKYEELMNKLYNDDFYQKEDSEWKTDLDVKNSFKHALDHEGNETCLDIDEEEADAIYDDGAAEYPDEEDYNESYGDEEQNELIPLSDGKESKLEKKLKEKMLDELYKLDYEDIIGDMPTRFKYRQVQPNRYGLTSEEILFARDSTLKQFVSLKRMAPYDEEGEYIPGTKKRKRFREMFKADYEDKNASASTKHENTNEESEQKKKKKRRQKKDKNKGLINDEVIQNAQTSTEGNTNNNTKKDDKSYKKSTEAKTEEDQTKKRKKSGHKKKEKSKAASFEGMSSSRLTSYGL